MDLQQHLIRQMAWSHATFGPGQRTDGVTDHLKKELEEVKQASIEYEQSIEKHAFPYPNELAREWVDVAILALDGLTRTLAYPEGSNNRQDPEMTAKTAIDMIIEKQTKNEARQWPNWRTADKNKAIEHLRDQKAHPMSYQTVTDQYIEKLFEATNFGAPTNASTTEKRKLLKKNLEKQIYGYWSGHTIYRIMIHGGFLIDAKSGDKKTLTALGHAFLQTAKNKACQQCKGIGHTEITDSGDTPCSSCNTETKTK